MRPHQTTADHNTDAGSQKPTGGVHEEVGGADHSMRQEVLGSLDRRTEKECGKNGPGDGDGRRANGAATETEAEQGAERNEHGEVQGFVLEVESANRTAIGKGNPLRGIISLGQDGGVGTEIERLQGSDN